jgi:hypothetical protein
LANQLSPPRRCECDEASRLIGPEILDALLEAGASAEMIVAAVKAAAGTDAKRREQRRARDAERQRRHRARRAPPSAVTPPSVTHCHADAGVTPHDGRPTPPNENKSNPPLPQSSDEDLTPELEKRVVTAWNETAAKAGAGRSRGLDGPRRAALRRRIAEHGEDAVFEAIRNLAATPFHCGRNKGGWRATLGWLLGNAEAFQRMLELTPSEDAQPPPMTPEQRAASAERSAALLDRMGRGDEAAELRRTAAKLRQVIETQPHLSGDA